MLNHRLTMFGELKQETVWSSYYMQANVKFEFMIKKRVKDPHI